MANDLHKRDYFTDAGLLNDPYRWIAAVREQSRIYHMVERDLYLVTGHEEAIEILRNHKDFSSVVATGGVKEPLPFDPEGEDIEAQIEAHRDQFTSSDLIAANDGERHTALRGLINRLFTPKRLKGNEDYMNGLAQQIIADICAKGQCEVIADVANPYVTMVIADLLGVPDEDRELFRETIDSGPPPFNIEGSSATSDEPSGFMVQMGTYFFNYISERRSNPREDVLTELTRAQFPDGSTPDDIDLVKTVMFVFGAGQDTTAKLLGNSIRYLAEYPEMQDALRRDRSNVNPFVEEMLRMEGSVKATFRLAKRARTVAGVEIPAGKRVVIFLAGGNRDPLRWPSPDDFQLNRERYNQHIAFGQGLHTCIGAPLARAEVRVLLSKLLDQTSSFSISEQHHGPAGKRSFTYDASYVVRGLRDLHIDINTSK